MPGATTLILPLPPILRSLDQVRMSWTTTYETPISASLLFFSVLAMETFCKTLQLVGLVGDKTLKLEAEL